MGLGRDSFLTLMARNIELKARCADLERARAAALAAGAVPQAVLEQVDTYFPAREGRLKLRRIAGERDEMIRYHRANETGTRASDYEIVVVPPELAAMLAETVVPVAVVAKRRELLLLDNIRIHLDTVERLGTFVEFEAVEGGAEAHARLEELALALGLRAEDRVARSYGDLIRAR